MSFISLLHILWSVFCQDFQKLQKRSSFGCEMLSHTQDDTQECAVGVEAAGVGYGVGRHVQESRRVEK